MEMKEKIHVVCPHCGKFLSDNIKLVDIHLGEHKSPLDAGVVCFRNAVKLVHDAQPIGVVESKPDTMYVKHKGDGSWIEVLI